MNLANIANKITIFLYKLCTRIGITGHLVCGTCGCTLTLNTIEDHIFKHQLEDAQDYFQELESKRVK